MKLLVLDRDGVINEDSHGYIKSPDEWHAIPGSADAISELSRAGWTVVAVRSVIGAALGSGERTATVGRRGRYRRRRCSAAGAWLTDSTAGRAWVPPARSRR